MTLSLQKNTNKLKQLEDSYGLHNFICSTLTKKTQKKKKRLSLDFDNKKCPWVQLQPIWSSGRLVPLHKHESILISIFHLLVLIIVWSTYKLYEVCHKIKLLIFFQNVTWWSPTAHIPIIYVLNLKADKPWTKGHIFISILMQYRPATSQNRSEY